MSKNTINYDGEINLNGFKIPCYVLEDGTRIVSGRGMQEAVKLLEATTKSAEQTTGSRMAEFTGSKWFNSLIINGEKLEEFKPINAYKGNQKISGYKATALADFCDIMLSARQNGLLNTERQKIVADQCEILIRGFARVGIIALVDEATGYQYDREKDELQKVLSAYISKELLPWQKRFPDEFYKEIFRLNGWDYTVSGIQKRPGVIGTWTKKLIYNLLPTGVLEELENKTPKSRSGNKTARLHQSLTQDIGEPHLEKQLVSVITLMNISDSWNEFLKNFGKKFQKDLIEIAQSNFKANTPKKITGQQYMIFEDPITQIQIPLEISDINKTDNLIEKANFGQILSAVTKAGKPQ